MVTFSDVTFHAEERPFVIFCSHANAGAGNDVSERDKGYLQPILE